MNSRTKLNLGLALIVVLLLAIVILKPSKEAPITATHLLDIISTLINQIRLVRPDKQALSFQRANEHWMMRTPKQAAANVPLLKRLSMIADVRCPLHYSVSELDLARLGLEPPRLRLILNHRVLSFGNTESLNQNRYIRVDDRVYLCADLYYPLLTGPAVGFMAVPTAH